MPQFDGITIGYLIVEAENARQEDPLVEAFGVDRISVEIDEFEDGREIAEDTDFETIRLPNATAPAQIDINPFMAVDAQDVWFRADGRLPDGTARGGNEGDQRRQGCAHRQLAQGSSSRSAGG